MFLVQCWSLSEVKIVALQPIPFELPCLSLPANIFYFQYLQTWGNTAFLQNIEKSLKSFEMKRFVIKQNNLLYSINFHVVHKQAKKQLEIIDRVISMVKNDSKIPLCVEG